MSDSLHTFVHEALGRGLPRADVERVLLQAGWPEDEVRSALGAYAEVDFPVPVPRPRPYLSAREAFLYLVLFTLLYASAWNFGSLLFQFIHRAFPDPAQHAALRDASAQAIRWSVAVLLIAFPGFLWLSRRAYAAARRDPEERKSRVRKWLTYLTLFVAAGCILGDLVTLVFYLLEGELTVRFLLKVLTVGAIAGSIFGYYLWDLRQDDLKPDELPPRRPGLRLFAGCVTAAVAAGIVAGLLLAGSPGSARQARLDAIRVGHLEQIATGIDLYYRDRSALPPDLETLQSTRDIRVESILDPVSEGPYEYRTTGERTYELCAVFDAASDPDDPGLGYRDPYRFEPRFWSHEAGRACFDSEAVDRGD